MKITAVQYHIASDAMNKTSQLLREIKCRNLKPKEVEKMKLLEAAVQHLEAFCMSVNVPL